MLAIPISSDSHLIPPIKDFPCPPSFCRTIREGFGQVSTNLDKFNHPTQTILASITRLSQIRCLTLDTCHCSWLNTLLLHIIQVVQGVMPWRRCQISIFLTKSLGFIFHKKKTCLAVKINIVAYSNPTKRSRWYPPTAKLSRLGCKSQKYA